MDVKEGNDGGRIKTEQREERGGKEIAKRERVLPFSEWSSSKLDQWQSSSHVLAQR